MYTNVEEHKGEQLNSMNFDCIIANPPYGKIGVDVTKNVIKQTLQTVITGV